MLTNRFASAFDKLARARDHADAWRSAETEYVATNPIAVAYAREGEEIVYRVDGFQPPSPVFSLIAGDSPPRTRFSTCSTRSVVVARMR